MVGVGVAVAGALLAAGGRAIWLADGDRQPHVQNDIAAMDNAVAAAISAAGDQAAVAVDGLVRASSCSVGALHHSGGIYSRAADVYTADEGALMTRIAAGISNQYDVRQPPGSAAVVVNVGAGVQLRVSRLGTGWFKLSAVTGCVIGPDETASSAPLPATVAQTMGQLLSILGVQAADTRMATLNCGADGYRTAVAISQPTDSANLASRLSQAIPAGVQAYPTTSNRVAYRDGPASVVIAPSDDATEVTVRYTTAC
jgi:hypothetical protein